MRIIVLSFLLFPLVSIAQHFHGYVKKADSLFKVNQFDLASDNYIKALALIEEQYIEPHELINIAKAFAMSGNSSKAMHYLFKLVERGGISAALLENTSEFRKMQQSSDWQQLIDEARLLEQRADSTLIKSLKAIGIADQLYRKKLDSLYLHNIKNRELRIFYADKQRYLDSVNLMQVTAILESHGFPSRVAVGRFNTVIFYVVQHADLKTQERYYPQFEQAATTGNLSWRLLCLMTDRIRMRKGLKQLYGTQFRTDSSGESTLYEVEDFDKLDNRRLKIGLAPIKEYTSFFGVKL